MTDRCIRSMINSYGKIIDGTGLCQTRLFLPGVIIPPGEDSSLYISIHSFHLVLLLDVISSIPSLFVHAPTLTAHSFLGDPFTKRTHTRTHIGREMCSSVRYLGLFAILPWYKHNSRKSMIICYQLVNVRRLVEGFIVPSDVDVNV